MQIWDTPLQLNIKSYKRNGIEKSEFVEQAALEESGATISVETRKSL
jgi:hypothetical protein